MQQNSHDSNATNCMSLYLAYIIVCSCGIGILLSHHTNICLEHIIQVTGGQKTCYTGGCTGYNNKHKVEISEINSKKWACKSESNGTELYKLDLLPCSHNIK